MGLKLPYFFHQTCFIAKFLYVVHKIGTNVNVQGPMHIMVISHVVLFRQFTLSAAWQKPCLPWNTHGTVNTIQVPHDVQNDT